MTIHDLGLVVHLKDAGFKVEPEMGCECFCFNPTGPVGIEPYAFRINTEADMYAARKMIHTDRGVIVPNLSTLLESIKRLNWGYRLEYINNKPECLIVNGHNEFDFKYKHFIGPTIEDAAAAAVMWLLGG